MENENTRQSETLEQENLQSIDDLETKVNALFDGVEESVDNDADVATFNVEEAITDMQTQFAELKAENQRLTAMIGKMVTSMGARLNDNSQNGVEAFPSSVEKQFSTGENNGVTPLSEIVLGS